MRIYLDYNASTPVLDSIKSRMPEWLDLYANPSSYHSAGHQPAAAIARARENIAQLIGAGRHRVFFVSSATEANSWAFSSTFYRVLSADPARRPTFVVSAVEHPSVIEAAAKWTGLGATVRYWPVDAQGRIDLAAADEVLAPPVDLVAVMLANNELGTLQPVAEVAALCRERRIPLHCDAVQALGKLPLDFDGLGVDSLALSGHKCYAPKGCGMMVLRRGSQLTALVSGLQENGKRGGTENTPAILATEAALMEVIPNTAAISGRIRVLRDKLAAGIRAAVPDVIVNTPLEASLPNTLNVSFKLLEGQALMLELDRRGIQVSTGSACHGSANDLSHVIRALGLDPLFERGSLRFSLGMHTTEAEIDHVLGLLPGIVAQLRGVL